MLKGNHTCKKGLHRGWMLTWNHTFKKGQGMNVDWEPYIQERVGDECWLGTIHSIKGCTGDECWLRTIHSWTGWGWMLNRCGYTPMVVWLGERLLEINVSWCRVQSPLVCSKSVPNNSTFANWVIISLLILFLFLCFLYSIYYMIIIFILVVFLVTLLVTTIPTLHSLTI